MTTSTKPPRVTPAIAKAARERRERIEKRLQRLAEGTPPKDFLWFYPQVEGIGSVAVSAHAARRAGKRGLSREDFEDILQRGVDNDAGVDIVHREKDGAVLVIKLHAEKSPGDAIVITMFFRDEHYDPLRHDKFE